MKKETKFERELRKACHLDAGLQVRDYYGGTMIKEYKDAMIPELLTVRNGDFFMLVSFKWKSAAHHARARKAVKRMMERLKAK